MILTRNGPSLITASTCLSNSSLSPFSYPLIHKYSWLSGRQSTSISVSLFPQFHCRWTHPPRQKYNKNLNPKLSFFKDPKSFSNPLCTYIEHRILITTGSLSVSNGHLYWSWEPGCKFKDFLVSPFPSLSLTLLDSSSLTLALPRASRSPVLEHESSPSPELPLTIYPIISNS